MPRKPNRSQHRSNPKIAFGLVLRQLREQSGDSQDSFAHRTGYHRNYVGQLERGEKSPSLNALFNLSKAVGLRPSQLLELVERRLGF
jgi:transcriptional regulator with XRE-family HTH domain